MDYRVIEKKAFTVYGIEEIFTTENGENLKAIKNFWKQAIGDGRIDKLAKSTNLKDSKGLCAVNAICDYRSTGGSTFPYMLFAFMTDQSNADGYKIVEISEATWVIFKTKEHTEDYNNLETGKCFCEIWIRVTPKE